MYLKTIYLIQERKRAARVTDIAKDLGVINSSVTGALKTLSARGLVHYAPYDIVTLTREGERVAEQIVQKYGALKNFFVTVLGVDEQTAAEDACHLEHRISGIVFQRLLAFVDYYEHCPYEKVQWNRNLGRFCSRNMEECRRCLDDEHMGMTTQESG